MYALVDIKGKQYKVEKGALVKIDQVSEPKGAQIEFNSVLLLKGDKEVKLGSPYIDGAKVKAVVEDQGKDKKIVVFKYKKRKGYRKRYGHRQAYSLIKIKEISGPK